MLLGELEAGVSLGHALADRRRIDQADTKLGSDDDEQVTHRATAAVVRVVHQEEGDGTVRVLDDDAGARVDSRSTGYLIFRAAC